MSHKFVSATMSNHLATSLDGEGWLYRERIELEDNRRLIRLIEPDGRVERVPVLQQVSHAPQIAATRARDPRSENSFPARLHFWLQESEKDGMNDVISWQPDGKSFLVHDKKRLVAQLLPNWFRMSKYESFQRQLNMYGFSRIVRGHVKGAYYHPSFVRDEPQLCQHIKRGKRKAQAGRASYSAAAASVGQQQQNSGAAMLRNGDEKMLYADGSALTWTPAIVDVAPMHHEALAFNQNAPLQRYVLSSSMGNSDLNLGMPSVSPVRPTLFSIDHVSAGIYGYPQQVRQDFPIWPLLVPRQMDTSTSAACSTTDAPFILPGTMGSHLSNPSGHGSTWDNTSFGNPANAARHFHYD